MGRAILHRVSKGARLDKVKVEPAGSKGSVLKDIAGKYFHPREAGESLLYLTNSKETSAVGTHWVKEEVDDERPFDFILSEKGCHYRVLRSAVRGLGLPLEVGTFWLSE